MKLLNFLEDTNFNLFRRAMEAPLSQYQVRIVLPPPTFKPRIPNNIVLPLPTEGLDVDENEIKVHFDGTLVYKEKRVLVHIRDAMGHEPRYHLSNCITLVEMRRAGKFEKYVVSERDNGYFYVRFNAGALEQRKLLVCQNCLHELSWNEFSRDADRNYRHAVVRDFSIKDFYNKFPNSLHPNLPKYDEVSAPVNNYPENWALIASQLKSQLGYSCQSCYSVVGEVNKRYLHVHHINGLKNDCRLENLLCLCISCHAEQPMHQHMKSLQEYREFKLLFP